MNKYINLNEIDVRNGHPHEVKPDIMKFTRIYLVPKNFVEETLYRKRFLKNFVMIT